MRSIISIVALVLMTGGFSTSVKAEPKAKSLARRPDGKHIMLLVIEELEAASNSPAKYKTPDGKIVVADSQSVLKDNHEGKDKLELLPLVGIKLRDVKYLRKEKNTVCKLVAEFSDGTSFNYSAFTHTNQRYEGLVHTYDIGNETF